MKTKQSKLLWIPRSLLILVGMFCLNLVMIPHRDSTMFLLIFFVLMVTLLISFLHPIISGGILFLFLTYFLFLAKDFNSFIYYPYTILLISATLLIIFAFIHRKSPNMLTADKSKQIIDKPRKISSFLIFCLFIFIPFLILISLITLKISIASPGYALSGSMSPTIRTNALLLINQVAYRKQNPRRGDIIQFTPIHKPEANYIKRVIGIPGDTIEWKDYIIYVNGKKLVEPYEFDTFTKTYKQTNEFPAVKLKDDEYFVMGDNRMLSYDGRFFDPVKRDAITGKVYFIHNPPEE